MMPMETKQAIEWALQQTVNIPDEPVPMVVQVTKDTRTELVDKVREYFNANGISYNDFSYKDLESFFN